jgi:hypothetical protein
MTHFLVCHHITGHLMFVLVFTEWVMMCPATDNPASCELRAVILHLHTKIMTAAEIHRELCTVYGPNVMSEGTGRQWYRKAQWINKGRSARTQFYGPPLIRTYMVRNVQMWANKCSRIHDEERSSRPSVVSDDTARSERRHFTISELSCEFLKISSCLLYEIITYRLGYHKFCSR